MPALSLIAEPSLEQLLAVATPEDTCRGMFFNGMLEAVRSLGGEDARARCHALAGDKKFVDFFSYPVTDFLKGVFTATDLLGPKLGGREAVLRQLGQRAAEDFLGSTVGKTMMALAGSEPHRLLASFPKSYRASVSYGERSVERLGDRQGRLVARRDFLPLSYNEGVISAAMAHSTAHDVLVRGRRLGPLEVEYEVSWS
jgi:uncharacterized protein (TIGR02265 family)